VNAWTKKLLARQCHHLQADLHGEIAKLFVTWTEFVDDSPLEGGGFEPSVPLLRMAPRPASAELWEVPRRHE
jgi:hypothetical protein